MQGPRVKSVISKEALVLEWRVGRVTPILCAKNSPAPPPPVNSHTFKWGQMSILSFITLVSNPSVLGEKKKVLA